MPLFYSLLLAHLIADFLQPAALVKQIKQNVTGLFVHTAVYTFLSALVLAGWGGKWWFWLILLSFSHFIVDHFKYLLSARLSLWGFYIFIVDQFIHIGIIALVVFGGNLAKLEPSPFLHLISNYWKLLPYVVGYIAGTFAASVLVFEARRTFAPQPGDAGNEAVITFKDRFLGIVERALAISLMLAHLYYLVPFSFFTSVYWLIERWKTNIRRRLVVELSTSVLSAVIVGFALLLLGNR